MVYHVITTEQAHEHKEIFPNLTLEEVNLTLDMFIPRTSISRVVVLKTIKGLEPKEQKKLLKKY